MTKTVEWRKRILKRLKANLGCATCGCKKPKLLVWHHIDPKTKVAKIHQLYSADGVLLMTELDKCVVLCRSCHNRLHAVARGREARARKETLVAAYVTFSEAL